MPGPGSRRGIEVIPVDHQRIVLAGVLAIVTQIAFSGDQLVPAVAIDIGQHQRVCLGPAGIDSVLGPAGLRVGLPGLFQPIQPGIVPAAPDQIAIAVLIDILDQDQGSTVAMQTEGVVPAPTKLAVCFSRSRRPQFRCSRM